MKRQFLQYLQLHGIKAADERKYENIPKEVKTSNDNERKLKRQYNCLSCEKVFNKASTLKKHARIHNIVKVHTCSVCSKTCKTISGLKSHETVHSDERPYKCTVCSRFFKHSWNLKVHKSVHI